MRKYFFILLTLIFLQSCKNEKELEKIKIENQQLKQQLEDRTVQKTKFLIGIIYNKRGTYTSYSTDGKEGFSGKINNFVNYTDIIETDNYDETSKYKILDELESDMRKRYGPTIYSIVNRECKVFDNYISASEYLRDIRDK